ncbi:ribosomal RNA large subunit methyltransferase E [Desulfosarcina ovata subsp. sediminis]|uniref:Ribosomal RNA large subunit methyltransferase E n=1 Tax=Desulfosarcina ovata subsp. sediminis TaxID=885957 RepID=A0A5K7ZS89_9BACT|nr:RlmE family RNA methyltransferase [Desulfosarcina ovata]BBO83064.1 ribosomal RNA large subunit methyltransferase E [Desulfosarcina ovata subsp. sediminis]
MKRSSQKKQNPWADHYTRQAKRDHFAARSVYKLQEIQKKHRILNRGARVLDLGCAPGSWLQFTARVIGPEGRLVGIDLSPVTIALPNHVTVITGDVADLEGHLARLALTRVDVVLSDMAPATTGNRHVDEARSVGLCEAALAIAESTLVTGGHFVCKIFQGNDFKTFTDAVKQRFQRQAAFRPKSTRKASREVFVIGLGKK